MPVIQPSGVPYFGSLLLLSLIISCISSFYQGASFMHAQCQGADFSVAQCQGANFRYAQCQGADFGDAQCQGAYALQEFSAQILSFLMMA
jgi:hypothetical protein